MIKFPFKLADPEDFLQPVSTDLRLNDQEVFTISVDKLWNYQFKSKNKFSSPPSNFSTVTYLKQGLLSLLKGTGMSGALLLINL